LSWSWLPFNSSSPANSDCEHLSSLWSGVGKSVGFWEGKSFNYAEILKNCHDAGHSQESECTTSRLWACDLAREKIPSVMHYFSSHWKDFHQKKEREKGFPSKLSPFSRGEVVVVFLLVTSKEAGAEDIMLKLTCKFVWELMSCCLPINSRISGTADSE
jgi:hypothetical protein